MKQTKRNEQHSLKNNLKSAPALSVPEQVTALLPASWAHHVSTVRGGVLHYWYADDKKRTVAYDTAQNFLTFKSALGGAPRIIDLDFVKKMVGDEYIASLPARPDHEFYMVIFEKPGIGTPVYFATRRALMACIGRCLTNGHPFHVGHEFRMTLDDGCRPQRTAHTALAHYENIKHVADKLIEAVEFDNDIRTGDILGRLKPRHRDELYAQLRINVGAMLKDGCKFTEDEIELMAAGEQTEAEDHFKKYAGYKEANAALGNLFDPERKWCGEPHRSKAVR